MTGAAPEFLSSLSKALFAASISDTAREIARTSMLDAVACIAVGWSSVQAVSSRKAKRHTGSSGPAVDAMILGTAAHALDYDDFEQPGSTHPSAVLVPVILALSRQNEIKLSQAEEAYVLGYRTILALGQAMRYRHYVAGWHATGTLGSIGAAVMAARLMSLDETQMRDALSLAMTQASGLKAQFGFGAKAIHAGLAARNGVEAAALAVSGVTGAPRAYEDGFATQYQGDGSAFSRLPDIEEYPPFRKLSPACGYTLRAIDAACDLSQKLVVDDIAKIEIHMAEPYANVAAYRAPRTAAEARFSATWCVAVGLSEGRVGVEHFEEVSLQNKCLRELEAKAQVVSYPLPDGAGDMAPSAPDRVLVRLQSGKTLEAEAAIPRGAPDRPLALAEFNAKLHACGLDARVIENFASASQNTAISPKVLLPKKVWTEL